MSEEDREAQDDEIFARARLVNCGWFMRVILGDYVGAILGLVRDGLSWRLDPLAEARELDHSVSPRGEGNVVSLEFNLMYRWHAAISQKDTEWTENIFEEVFETRDFKSVSISCLLDMTLLYLTSLQRSLFRTSKSLLQQSYGQTLMFANGPSKGTLTVR